MRPYIVNLTNNLIGKNDFDATIQRMGPKSDKFIDYVQLTLEAGDISKMSSSKLGEIMSSFEVGDVMAGKELLGDLGFNGDCDDLLRHLVARCLAFVIRDRLTGDLHPQIPRWEGRLPGFRSSFERCLNDYERKVVNGKLTIQRRR